MSQFEAAFALGNGVGERAFLMSEEFALDEGLGDGGAVELDEGRAGARALAVERPGHKFLAGAAFALDQHGGVGAGDFADERAKLLHAGAVAQQLEALFLVALAEVLRNLHQLRVFFGLFEGDGQVLGRNRLGEERERSVAHALDGHVHRSVVRDHHDQRAGGPGVDLFKQFDAVAIRQFHVDDHQVEVVLAEQFDGAGDVLGAGDIVSAVSELLLEGLANDKVVLQYDDFFDRHLVSC